MSVQCQHIVQPVDIHGITYQVHLVVAHGERLIMVTRRSLDFEVVRCVLRKQHHLIGMSGIDKPVSYLRRSLAVGEGEVRSVSFIAFERRQPMLDTQVACPTFFSSMEPLFEEVVDLLLISL